MTVFRKKKRIVRVILRVVTFVFINIWVFNPIVPILNVPFLDEDIHLGIEVPRAFADPYSNGYSYRRTLTINESQVTGSGDLTAFPVLVSLTDPTFRTTGNGGRVTDTQGDDIIFTSDAAGTVVLDFERERYTPTTGEMTMWVEVPTLDFNNDTVIYIFYGNSSVTTSQEDITGTWDGNYAGVWHLHETAGQHLDSTSNNNDSTSVSVTTQGSAAGLFSGADSFNGTSNVISIPDSSSLDLTTGATLEAWMNVTSTSTSEVTFSTWTSRTAPTGIGAGEYSQLDSVVVGEVVYYGAVTCTTAADTFLTATSTLNMSTFSGWTTRTSPDGACATDDGTSIGVDSNGSEIWYAVLNNDSTTANFGYATSSLDQTRFSAWIVPGDPSGIQLGESSSIDVTVTGQQAFFGVGLQAGTTEDFEVARVNLNGSGWSGWNQALTLSGVAGNADEGQGISVNSNGDRIYYDMYGNANGVGTYRTGNTPLNGASVSSWVTVAAPGAGSTNHVFSDSTFIGDHLYHAVYSFTAATPGVETYQTGSTTPNTATPAVTWRSRQDSANVPGGTSATNSADPAVESDGKNIFYSAFAHDGTTPVWYTASSTLPAHPFVSKFASYEMIHVGDGFVFDWTGKPTTFGTSTPPSTWKHVMITHDGTTMDYYIDGSLVASTTVATSTAKSFFSGSSPLLIGGGNRADSQAIYFPGTIDEVRVSNTARSADWIKTQYNNQFATSTFYTLGAEEEDTALPSVSTNFANPGATTALLNGTLTAGGSATEHGFAYSTVATLNTGVSTTTLGALSGNISFNNSIGSLTEGVTYYFRAYATNAAGTAYGVIKSFTAGNSNPTRMLRLFEGFKVKLLDGKMILHQK